MVLLVESCLLAQLDSACAALAQLVQDELADGLERLEDARTVACVGFEVRHAAGVQLCPELLFFQLFFLFLRMSQCGIMVQGFEACEQEEEDKYCIEEGLSP